MHTQVQQIWQLNRRYRIPAIETHMLMTSWTFELHAWPEFAETSSAISGRRRVRHAALWLVTDFAESRFRVWITRHCKTGTAIGNELEQTGIYVRFRCLGIGRLAPWLTSSPLWIVPQVSICHNTGNLDFYGKDKTVFWSTFWQSTRETLSGWMVDSVSRSWNVILEKTDFSAFYGTGIFTL